MGAITQQSVDQQNMLKWLPKLRRFVAGKVQQPEVIDDVVQETLTRTYQSTDTSSLINPLAYLITVANSVLADHWRRHQLEQPLAHDDDREQTPSLENHWLANKQLAAMLAVLEAMPPLRQQVFVMRRVHGLTRQQIAQQLALTEASVKKHITRAMVDITLASQSQGWLDE